MAPALLAALLVLAPVTLRVGLTRSAAEVQVTGPVTLTPPRGEPLAVTDPLVRLVEGALHTAGRAWPAELLVAPTGDRLRVVVRARPGAPAAARTYRGQVALQVVNGRLAVVNHVALEDYLRGVVPRETAGPTAALQAQAIASRSLALFHRGPGTKALADLWVPYPQAYGGADAETAATDAAVAATAGRVLTVHGELLEAVFSHGCGGVCNSAEEAWGATIPGLLVGLDETPRRAGVVDEAALRELLNAPRGWCRADPAHRWRETRPLADWLALATRRLPAVVRAARVGPVRDLQVVRRGPSGRVGELRVVGEQGTVLVRGESIRSLLATTDYGLKSTLFVLDRSGDRLSIRGGGWGHGVGLCQAGANGLAAAGAEAEAILRHYYPGATVAAAAPAAR